MHSERISLRGAPTPNRELTVKLVAQCPPKEQRGIIREIANTYQLETQKQKWTNDADGNCPYCMKPDSKSHRHYQCQATSEVWEQYPQLISELEELDDIHVNLPVVFQPPELDFLQFCYQQDSPPDVIPEVHAIIHQQLERGIVPTFYSDGSCFNPNIPVASLAAWGLILSLDTSEGERVRAQQTCISVEAVTNHFLVVATARCHGTQSIDRAELQAMVFLHETYRETRLVTDSQYAIDSWKRILETSEESSLECLANSDLLKRLKRANHGAQHEVYKVSSHTWGFGQTGSWPSYDALGNEVADHVAKAANNGLNPPLVAEWRKFQTQLQWDLQRRKKHYGMLGKLHKCQTKLAEQRESSTQGMQLFMGKLGRSVFDVMASYEPGNFFYKDVHWEAGVNFDMECKSEFAAEVLQFWNDIQWPSGNNRRGRSSRNLMVRDYFGLLAGSQHVDPHENPWYTTTGIQTVWRTGWRLGFLSRFKEFLLGSSKYQQIARWKTFRKFDTWKGSKLAEVRINQPGKRIHPSTTCSSTGNDGTSAGVLLQGTWKIRWLTYLAGNQCGKPWGWIFLGRPKSSWALNLGVRLTQRTLDTCAGFAWAGPGHLGRETGEILWFLPKILRFYSAR